MISSALLFAAASQIVATAEVPSAHKLEATVIAGDWKALAENSSGDAVGHFSRAAANGVMGNYRIMKDEFKQSRGGEAAIEEFCARLLKEAPKNGYARFVEGVRLYDKGETEKAIATYKKATELNPKFAAPFLQIGLHYGQKANNRTEQMAWIDKAIVADARFCPAYVSKGVAYCETGRRDLALDQFKKAVELLDTANVSTGQPLGQAYYNLGWMFINQASPDNDKGIAMMRKAIAADPWTLEAYNELGIALKRKGQFAEAVATYKEGMGKGAGDATMYFNLGVAEYRNGNSAAAKTAFEKAISLDQGGSVGGQARQWLGRM